MTLAKILVVSLLLVAGSTFVCLGAPQEPPKSEPSANSQNSQQSATQPAGQTESPVKPSAAPKQTAKIGAKKTRRKKKAIEECTPATEVTATKSGIPPPQSDTATTTEPAVQAQGAPVVKKCPPAKIVVNQGGTTDSSIQLAGGAPKQTSQARATAEPMIDETESNLKKLEGRQLSSAEQDMVTQIRQYVEQSKTAVAAGDVERARTLAWKAQTLSEDLVKPEKQ